VLRLRVASTVRPADLDAARLRLEPWLAALTRSPLPPPGLRAPVDADGLPPDMRAMLAYGLVLPAIRGLHVRLGLAPPAEAIRLASRPSDVEVAFSWRLRETAGALAARALAAVQAALAGEPLEARAAGRGFRLVTLRDRWRGSSQDLVHDADRRIPVVAVTGTNGKTTTTRALTHLLRAGGRHVGMATSDGVWIDDRRVLGGDRAGPIGARRVLGDPAVEVAVLETARGGIVQDGLAWASNDVAVVTNVTADHLGLEGIDTLEEMAEVKLTVARLTRPGGRVVLNADDPRTLGMASRVRTPVVLVSRMPAHPAVRAHLAAGGEAVVVDAGAIVALSGARRSHVAMLDEVPLTFAGRAVPMVENVLSVTGAALALGLHPAEIARGLATYRNSPEQNRGRLNVFRFREPDCTVVVDFAHNPEGLRHLLAFGQAICVPGARILATISCAGDRPEDAMVAIGALAGAAADHVWICEVTKHLRGNTRARMTALFAAGVDEARGAPGGYSIAAEECAALADARARARANDVILMMCYESSDRVLAWLADRATWVDLHAELACPLRIPAA